MQEITDIDSFVQDNKLVLIDVWAPWCAPCKKVAPILEDLEKIFTDVAFGKLNADNHASLLDTMDVVSVPTIIVLNQTKEVGRLVGVKSKTDYTNLLYFMTDQPNG